MPPRVGRRPGAVVAAVGLGLLCLWAVPRLRGRTGPQLKASPQYRVEGWVSNGHPRSPQDLVASNTSIPRVVHQLWLGTRRPPCRLMESWRGFVARHPGWEYRLWTDADVAGMALQNRHLFEAERNWASKSDIVRYELLFTHGGVYIDSDSLWLGRSLDPLLDAAEAENGLFAAYEPREGVPPRSLLAVGVIGAARGHPALLHVIRNLALNYHHNRVVRQTWFFQATGPDFFTAALAGVPMARVESHVLYPGGWWHVQAEALSVEVERLAERYPDSLMVQYGFSTNAKLRAKMSEGCAALNPCPSTLAWLRGRCA